MDLRTTVVRKNIGKMGLTFDHNSTCINKLQFSICDPDWCERQEAIKLVSFRYRDIWSETYGACRENDENHGQSNVAISKPYISGFFCFSLDHTFEEIIFPKGDPDAVSISKRDVELLSPETFINDTIIDFYIKYLKSRLLPENQPRFHFFNSFFFRKLADLDKDPFSSHEGREAFERVRKWTRKVNIFDKDYVFIPVNYSHHWSLIVICHPGEVAYFRDEGCEKLLRVPCILHMDSMKGSHRGLKNLVQSYLYEEWKARHEEKEDDALLKFLHLRFISLELPQQQNSYDCGLFLLHYVELFLEEAPVNFSPFNITKFSHFLNRKWFPVEEASLKRSYIQKLIYQILEDQCQKVPPSESSNRNNSFQFAATRQELETEILEKRSRTPNAWKSYSFSSKADMRIGTSLSAITSPRVIQQQFRVGSARPFPGGIQWQTGVTSHWRSLSSSIEEAEGNSQQVTNLSPDREDNWQIPRLSTECSTTLQLDSGFNHLKTSQNQISTRIEEKLNENLSCETCTVESQKSSEIGVEEDYMFVECERLHNPIQTDRQECSSKVLATCVVADSQETNCTEDANQEKDSCSSILRKGSNRNNRPDSSV
ncbi:hypothetical protein K2173_024031 [Erythroxylum novogranatense]|uniref:Ubiquitin-like protease family profile domain-containing protein n=1 Tax=Erythroxylum novogranatense TaxID=1862640 RepID=A0AAV8TSX8_9ROSI|nr:hypothetical protein K2173_024031 [Erythroxylum novogranatense]